MSDFAHLHVHTQYSILDGACRIDAALELAKQLGMKSMAITDHGAMYGVVAFYKKALEAGVHPVIGAEIHIAPKGRFSKQGGADDQLKHLVLLAKNNTGYKNLIKIVTRGFTEGFYYKPRVDEEVLREHSEGLIALSACLKGEVPSAYLEKGGKEAFAAIDKYLEIFGDENFFLELMDHGIEEQKEVNKFLIDAGKRKGVPLVVTNDVHYLRREDAKAHDYLLCIQTGAFAREEKRMRFSSEEFYMKTPEEILKLFPDFPEALAKTEEIAQNCDVEIELGNIYLPRYEPPEGFDTDSYLNQLARKGIKEKYGEVPPDVEERLERELDVIKKLGFSGYFLIVWDFVTFAKRKGIRVGPGRGSAAGSLVAYALGITTIDPMRFGLLFERFLNPERIALPDIDIDFSHTRRQEVIDYVVQKYGREKVAQIVSFSTLNARAAVKDVGRVLEVPFKRMDAITKVIPDDPSITIDVALEMSPELREAYNDDPSIREVIDTARSLEGLIRHDTVHAAGVVIADDELTEYMPLQRKGGNQDEIISQFDMYDIESLGLLKVDFLGLRNQTLLELAVKLIEERHGIHLDIDNIPMDDPDTFRLIQSGQTIGTFQLASPGMRALMKEMVPSKFEDLIALIALYRPGPLKSNMHKVFIDHKHGRVPVRYPHPCLEEILKETYGVIVYQEQAMKIAQVLAGYSGLEADELRKAMAKKKPEIMQRHRDKFIEGAVRQGIERKTAASIFDLIEKFGGYGFNKSHSTAYAFVSYQTAYLKTHYPEEYMAALMTTYMDNQDRLVEYINECRRMGITVKTPEINLSKSYFTPGDGEILFGLSAIRNVGSSAVEQIIACREQGGPLKSFAEFCRRVPSSVLNRKTVESLVKAGAFDSVEPDRRRLINSFEHLMKLAQIERKDAEEGQFTLFGGAEEQEETLSCEPEDTEGRSLSRNKVLAYEKEMLGVYVSDHPLSEWKAQLAEIGEMEISQLTTDADRTRVTIGGIVTRVEKRYNKDGKPWIAFTLEDFTGSIEILVFSNKYEGYVRTIREDAILVVKGRADIKENSRRVLAEEIIALSQKLSVTPSLAVRIESASFEENLVAQIKSILLQHPGQSPVVIRVWENGEEIHAVKLGDFYSVEIESDLLAKLRSLLGERAVQITWLE